MSELLTRKYQREPVDIARRRMQITDAARAARRFVTDHGINYPDGFEGLSPTELLFLGINVIQSRNVQEVYRYLAAISPTGLCYYDEVIGIQHIEGYLALCSALMQSEPKMVDVGVDIGAGSGESALILSSRAKLTIALDAMPELLPVAEKKLRAAGVNHKTMVADITNLAGQIPPNSVDIVTCSALQSYLNPSELEESYRAVYNVLVPGGRYYEYRYDYRSDFLPPAIARYKSSPRGKLIQQIAKEVLSFTFVPEQDARRGDYSRRHPPKDFGFVGEEIGFYNAPSGLTVLRLVKV